MTVILNEGALVALFESPPVVAFVERTAQRVVVEAQRNVRGYFASAPSLDVDQDVGLQMNGNRATIGIKDAGSKSQRMARYQAEGRVNWLSSALEAARGG